MDNSAEHIASVERITDDIMQMGGNANLEAGVGTGGMATKLQAARIATRAGCDMIICDGRSDNPLASLDAGAAHTRFAASTDTKGARAQWIGGSLSTNGKLVIDDGAAAAVLAGKSLLAVGVKDVAGAFEKGDSLSICNIAGVEIARGLSAYDGHDLEAVKGLRSDAIKHPSGAVIIHSDNLVTL
jgi:glutamate 5-kinase